MIISSGQTVGYIPQSQPGFNGFTLYMPDNLPPFSRDSSYTFQGGTLIIAPASWQGLISPAAMVAPHTITLNPGTGGTLLVDYGALNGTTLQTSLALNVYLTSSPPSSFKIQLAFSTQGGSKAEAQQRYDATSNQTTIQLNEDYSSYSSAHTNIFIPGNPYQLSLDGQWSSIPLASQAASSSPELVCYLAGTLIDTPDGPVPVERLRPGDAIHVFHDRQKRVEYLRWVGRKSVTATSPDDWPIRIRPHTFGENCPFQDLYVTEEHCLFLKGAFVPARMLVNDHTITREERTAYDIYHIETYEHRIISANGALSETYLDTGNRSSFITPDDTASLQPQTASPSQTKDWAHDAAAPLKVERDFVEPLHAALTRRAMKLGFSARAVSHPTTDNPALTLLDSQGTELALFRQDGRHYIFQLRQGSPFLLIRSRTTRPDRSIGPFVDDRRQLGVLVGDITLTCPDGTDLPLTSHLTAPAETGWDVVEATPCRWTNGEARLPLPDIAPGAGCLLKLEILSAGPYVLSEAAQP